MIPNTVKARQITLKPENPEALHKTSQPEHKVPRLTSNETRKTKSSKQIVEDLFVKFHDSQDSKGTTNNLKT